MMEHGYQFITYKKGEVYHAIQMNDRKAQASLYTVQYRPVLQHSNSSSSSKFIQQVLEIEMKG
jgi:hypothetical protein